MTMPNAPQDPRSPYGYSPPPQHSHHQYGPPAPPAPAPKPKKNYTGLIVFIGIVALLLIIGVSNSGNRGALSPPPTGTGVTTATAAPMASASFTAAEDRFWAEMVRTTEIERRHPQAFVVTIGHDVCNAMDEWSRPALNVSMQMQSNWSASETIAFLDTAPTYLCPGKSFADDAVVTSTTPPPPPAPASTITVDSVYEVGVDIQAGKWKSSGNGSGMCYWARLKPDSRDIIDNNISGSADTVVVHDGELFEVQGCGTWSRVQ
jgi:hypothetical protein